MCSVHYLASSHCGAVYYLSHRVSPVLSASCVLARASLCVIWDLSHTVLPTVSACSTASQRMPVTSHLSDVISGSLPAQRTRSRLSVKIRCFVDVRPSCRGEVGICRCDARQYTSTIGLIDRGSALVHGQWYKFCSYKPEAQSRYLRILSVSL